MMMIRLLVPGVQRFGFQMVFASGKMIVLGNLKTTSALATEFGLAGIASKVQANELQDKLQDGLQDELQAERCGKGGTPC